MERCDYNMLELKNVSIGYDGRYLIPKVSLTFEPGKVYSVVGKNGSGKSDLLRTCAGLGKLRTGSVVLNGTDVYTLSSQELSQKISFFDSNRKTGRVTSQKLIAQGLQAGRKKLTDSQWGKVFSTLGMMQVSGLAAYPLQNLSCGERQRVQLAAEIIKNTSVLVLDDPMANLDPEFRQILMKYLIKLRNEGKIIIMALHDLDLALRCSDEILAIEAGRQIHRGTPEKLLEEKRLQQMFHIEL